jgi:hypothetical protein
MFESILGAVLAHKQLAIAAIAISGLVVYAFPYNTMFAQADHLAVNIDEEIEIPCLPYCNIANEPEDLDFEVAGTAHVQITFTFVPA